MEHNAENWLDVAAQLAVSGLEAGEGGPFGAVVVRNNVIVGKGWNQVFKNTDPTAHAEVQAIRDACKHLNTVELVGCTIYSTAEPCPMCMAAIYWSYADATYFANTKEQSAKAGFNDAKIYRELSLPWNARKMNLVHFPHEGSARAFQLWETMKNNAGNH